MHKKTSARKGTKVIFRGSTQLDPEIHSFHDNGMTGKTYLVLFFCSEGVTAARAACSHHTQVL